MTNGTAKRLGVALIAVVISGCHSPAPPAPAAPAAGGTLYHRLGGYDAIAAVTDDFLTRLLGDPKMQPYFENVDAAGRKRIRQMIVDQLCAASGGPCIYAGAGMPTAHKDLQISDRAFDVAAQYLAETLDKF